MAAYNKFNQFIEDVHHGVHDFENDSFVVALCASANAPVAANSVLADLTVISYANLSSRALTVSASGQTAGVYKPIFDDLIISASGGAAAAFRYIVIYNDTPTSPADPLVCWYDYGSSQTLLDGEQITLDFDGSGGLFSAT